MYSFPDDKVKIKAYMDTPLVVVHPFRPELLKIID
jgi:hypothetical protein